MTLSPLLSTKSRNARIRTYHKKVIAATADRCYYFFVILGKVSQNPCHDKSPIKERRSEAQAERNGRAVPPQRCLVDQIGRRGPRATSQDVVLRDGILSSTGGDGAERAARRGG